MSVERSNVGWVQECIDCLERSLEQRLTNDEMFIIVLIKNGGAGFLQFSVDIIKDGKSLGIENFYVENGFVYSNSEWNSRGEG